jgi:hypothetical protein
MGAGVLALGGASPGSGCNNEKATRIAVVEFSFLLIVFVLLIHILVNIVLSRCATRPPMCRFHAAGNGISPFRKSDLHTHGGDWADYSKDPEKP